MTIPVEEWRIIPQFPNYKVSSFGRIARATDSPYAKAGHVLKLRNGKGYYYCNLISADGTKTIKAHRAVALAFIGPPPSPQHVVSHINGNSLDNRVENLRWATITENNRDKQLHGTQNRGENLHLSKLVESDVVRIRQMAAEGVSQNAIARAFNVRKGTVQFIVHRKTWRHVQ